MWGKPLTLRLLLFAVVLQNPNFSRVSTLVPEEIKRYLDCRGTERHDELDAVYLDVDVDLSVVEHAKRVEDVARL